MSDVRVAAALGYIKSTWPKRPHAFQVEVTTNDESGA